MTHIRFDDGDMDYDAPAPGPSQQQQQPTQLAPCPQPTGLLTPHCCASIKVDYSKDPAYVFRLIASPGALAASTSSQQVKLYSLQGGSSSSGKGPALTHVGNLEGHTGTITGLEFAPDNPSVVYTSSQDGSVRTWDTRTGQQAQSFTAPNQELLCLSAQDQLLAAGAQGEVLFWDRRTARAMSKLEDTHMDDVTQVKFCPSSSSHVISGSLDGLVAVHDTTHALTHDDAFVAAINVATSVEELGVYGQQDERLWVRTGTETLHLWEWRRTVCENQQGGEGAFAEFAEARDTATQVAQAAGGPAAQVFFEGVGYIAGCHYDLPTRQLMMVAGHEGDVGFFPIAEQACPSGSGVLVGASFLPPVMLLAGVHTSVVRSFVCGGQEGMCCVTGGEDAQICLWTLDASLPAHGQAAVAAGGGRHANGVGHKHLGGEGGGGAGPMRGHGGAGGAAGQGGSQGRGAGERGERGQAKQAAFSLLIGTAPSDVLSLTS